MMGSQASGQARLFYSFNLDDHIRQARVRSICRVLEDEQRSLSAIRICIGDFGLVLWFQ